MTWKEFVGYIKKVFQLYLVFQGRARRKEYWSWILFSIVAYYVLFSVIGLITAGPTTAQDNTSSLTPCLSLLGLAVFLLIFIPPTVAVSVRRLHDTGRSGLWFLLSFVPFGFLILLFFFLQRGQPGENRYGPDPRAEEVGA